MVGHFPSLFVCHTKPESAGLNAKSAENLQLSHYLDRTGFSGFAMKKYSPNIEHQFIY